MGADFDPIVVWAGGFANGSPDLFEILIVMQAVRSERLAKGSPTIMSEDKRVLYSAVKAR